MWCLIYKIQSWIIIESDSLSKPWIHGHTMEWWALLLKVLIVCWVSLVAGEHVLAQYAKNTATTQTWKRAEPPMLHSIFVLDRSKCWRWSLFSGLSCNSISVLLNECQFNYQKKKKKKKRSWELKEKKNKEVMS